MLETLQAAFTTLLVTIDPPGVAPVFLALTAGMKPGQRREVGLRASVVAFGVLALFAAGGRLVLNALGISLAAFRIAGGLLLFYIAVEMIFGREERNKEDFATQAVTRDHISDIAAFPLAIPLLAGPGSITATILLTERAQGDWLQLLALAGVIALILSITFAFFVFAVLLERLLGRTGQIVLSRMLGVVLAALAVQFVIDGVLSFMVAPRPG